MSQKLVDLERLPEMVEAGLKSWGTYTGDDELPLNGLLLVRERSKAAQENGQSSQLRTIFAEILEDGIQELEGNASTEVAILGLVLRLRVVEGLTIAEVVNKLTVGQTRANPHPSYPLHLVTPLVNVHKSPVCPLHSRVLRRNVWRSKMSIEMSSDGVMSERCKS